MVAETNGRSSILFANNSFDLNTDSILYFDKSIMITDAKYQRTGTSGVKIIFICWRTNTFKGKGVVRNFIIFYQF